MPLPTTMHAAAASRRLPPASTRRPPSPAKTLRPRAAAPPSPPSPAPRLPGPRRRKGESKDLLCKLLGDAVRCFATPCVQHELKKMGKEFAGGCGLVWWVWWVWVGVGWVIGWERSLQMMWVESCEMGA